MPKKKLKKKKNATAGQNETCRGMASNRFTWAAALTSRPGCGEKCRVRCRCVGVGGAARGAPKPAAGGRRHDPPPNPFRPGPRVRICARKQQQQQQQQQGAGDPCCSACPSVPCPPCAPVLALLHTLARTPHGPRERAASCTGKVRTPTVSVGTAPAARPPQFGWPVIFRLIPFGGRQTRMVSLRGRSRRRQSITILRF